MQLARSPLGGQSLGSLGGTSRAARRTVRAARHTPRAEYRKGGEESKQVDGRVTQLWKYFFRPASGTTDRLGFSIPMGNVLDQRTDDERFQARQDAARQAVNIDWEERQRRLIFGGALLVVTGYIVYQLVVNHAGPFQRLGVLPIFFLGAAEMASGISGL